MAERKLKEMKEKKKKEKKKKKPKPWYKDFWCLFGLSTTVLAIAAFAYFINYLNTSYDEKIARYKREQSCRERTCEVLCNAEKAIGTKTNRITSGIIKCVCYHSKGFKAYHMLDTCKEKENGS